MTDLGIYNFIKNELAHGQTREQIKIQLSKNNLTQSDIDEAFASIDKALGTVPTPSIQDLPHGSENPNFSKSVIRTPSLIVLIVVILVLSMSGIFIMQNHGSSNVSTLGNIQHQTVQSYTISTLDVSSLTSGTVKNTITTSTILPDNATVTDFGNGFKKYTNPTLHVSFNFPADRTVNIQIRNSKPYSVTLNKGDASSSSLNIGFYDQNDAVSTLRGKPLPHPEKGTNDMQSVIVDNAEFLLWDNVAFSQKYGRDSFEVESTNANELTFLPGNKYSLSLSYQFNSASDLASYMSSLKQVVSSLQLTI